jgi:hypothetical protein
MKKEPPLPTSAEIDRRLRLVSELRNLCLSLGRARPMRDASLPPPEFCPEDPSIKGVSSLKAA